MGARGKEKRGGGGRENMLEGVRGEGAYKDIVGKRFDNREY